MGQQQLLGSCRVTAAARNNHDRSSQGTAEEFQRVAGAALTGNWGDRAQEGCIELEEKLQGRITGRVQGSCPGQGPSVLFTVVQLS